MKLRFADQKINNKPLSFSTHGLAVLSICIYIVCAVVFEFTAISLPVISSYSLYFCLACCALNCLVKGKITFHWTMGALLLLGILIWISCLYTPASARYTDTYLYRYWTSFVLCFLIVSVRPKEKDIFKIVYAFIIAGVILASYVYVYYGVDVLINLGSRMEHSNFGNVNVVGSYCAMSAMLAIYAMLALKGNKILCIAATVICVPCILFTGSRRALLTVVVCILAFLFIYYKNSSLIKRILISVSLVLVILWIIDTVPAFEPIRERFVGLFDMFSGNDATIEGDENRIYYMTEGLKMFWERPLFGNGFCYSYYVFGTYSHNNYVEMLMCNGIVGFVLYYSVLVGVMIGCFRSQIDERIKMLVYILLVKFVMDDIGMVTYYNRMSFVIIALLICCVLTGEAKNKIDTNNSMKIQNKSLNSKH